MGVTCLQLASLVGLDFDMAGGDQSAKLPPPIPGDPTIGLTQKVDQLSTQYSELLGLVKEALAGKQVLPPGGTTETRKNPSDDDNKVDDLRVVQNTTPDDNCFERGGPSLDHLYWGQRIEQGYREQPPASQVGVGFFDLHRDPFYYQLVAGASPQRASALEYQSHYCTGFFTSCAHAALGDLLDSLKQQAGSHTAEQLLEAESVLNTLEGIDRLHRLRLTVMRYLKSNTATADERAQGALLTEQYFTASKRETGSDIAAAFNEDYSALLLRAKLKVSAGQQAGKGGSPSKTPKPTGPKNPKSEPKDAAAKGGPARG